MFDLDGAGPLTIPYAEIRTIRFTGRDTAAGNSYAAWLRAKEAAKGARQPRRTPAPRHSGTRDPRPRRHRRRPRDRVVSPVISVSSASPRPRGRTFAAGRSRSSASVRAPRTSKRERAAGDAVAGRLGRGLRRARSRPRRGRSGRARGGRRRGRRRGRSFHRALPGLRRAGTLLTVDEVVATAELKARLWMETGALACDMESVPIVEWAARARPCGGRRPRASPTPPAAASLPTSPRWSSPTAGFARPAPSASCSRVLAPSPRR